MGGDHLGVAGQLLIDAQVMSQHVDHRVEPVEAAGQRHGGVDARVLAGDVGFLVGEDHPLFARRVAAGEVAGRDDPGAQDADHRGPGPAGADRAAELRLAPDEVGQGGHGAGDPERGENGGEIGA